jgi:plasmid stabilization system protein ParE
MTASILDEAEADLDQAFEYYQMRRAGLGGEFVDEFRHGVERILEHPGAWQPLDSTYRRYRLHRFPYGIIYRIEPAAARIVIVAVMHMSRRPDWWRDRKT